MKFLLLIALAGPPDIGSQLYPVPTGPDKTISVVGIGNLDIVSERKIFTSLENVGTILNIGNLTVMPALTKMLETTQASLGISDLVIHDGLMRISDAAKADIAVGNLELVTVVIRVPVPEKTDIAVSVGDLKISN